MTIHKYLQLAGAAALCLMSAVPAQASSHREAPFITEMPKVDGTDFYMFRSYETGRSGYVTLIANYIPLQDAYGGPNYFFMDPEALYEIHVSNDGDANEEVTFQFRFTNNYRATALMVGATGAQKSIKVPLRAIGPVTAGTTADPDLTMVENFTVDIVRGDRRTGTRSSITGSAGATFIKPIDNIGTKTIANYPAYAAAHIYDVTIPNCTAPASTSARVFVGQREEAFAVNLGQIFDLVNLPIGGDVGRADVLGLQDQGFNDLADKNITSLAIEVPIACLTAGTETVLGGWTTASVRQTKVHNPRPQGPATNRSATPSVTGPTLEGGAFVQVSRLGMPLVNEVVIGITDKDRFNASHPRDDGQFADYVTHPVLPELLEILYGSANLPAPNNFPRTDLVAAFLTGVAGVNKPTGVAASEMLRLNTALPVTAAATQNTYGAALCFDRTATGGVVNTTNAGCDVAGFPNGRRPADDVVDIELRVAEGYLAPTGDAPSGAAAIVDGAFGGDATTYLPGFPYLNHPIPGSP